MQTLLRNVRVFDGERFSDATDLLIDGGVIAGGPSPGTPVQEIDGAHGYLVPGLIDCHVHLSGPTTQAVLAEHGVTTGLDMSSPAPLVQAMRGRAGVADIRSSMMAMSSPTSAHAQRLKDVPAAAEALVGSVGEVRDAVARRVGQGADYLKVVIDLPGFDVETVAAIVAAARGYGLATVAHAARKDALDMAQHVGVDILTHVPLDRRIEPGQAAELAASGTIVVPTLTMMRAIVGRLDRLGVRGLAYEAASSSVAALHAVGVPILAGTDANETPAAPASPAFGSSLHEELELLVAAGLTPLEALRSATSAPAEHFDLDDRGRIAPGLRADLLLLGSDPTDRIAATRDIRRIWVAGQPVEPAS